MQAQQAFGILGVAEVSFGAAFDKRPRDDAFGFQQFVEERGKLAGTEAEGRGNLPRRNRRAAA